jgi:hypothetical protein
MTRNSRPSAAPIVWRVATLCPDGRMFSMFAGASLKEKRPTTPHTERLSPVVKSSCPHDQTHRPPVASCVCGTYGVRDLAEVLNHLIALDFDTPPQYVNRQAQPRGSRAVLIRGALTKALPAPPTPGAAGELVPVWSDGHIGGRPFFESITRAMTRAWENAPDPEVIGYGVNGDPPSTVRGRTLRATDLFVHGAAPQVPSPIRVHTVGERLSTVLRRFLDSGRTDTDTWWLPSHDPISQSQEHPPMNEPQDQRRRTWTP